MAKNSTYQLPSPHDYKPSGYHRMADLMSGDKRLAIFRRFDKLNILSLLNLQAEICEIRKEFRQLCQADGHFEYAQYSEDFKLSRERKPKQYEKLEYLRTKLREYSKSC
jgi:hypothetical protein